MINLIKLVLISSLILFSKSETCEELNCSVCCMASSSGDYCTDDRLICFLKSSTDFTKLSIAIIIICSFLIGLPILLLLFEFLILRRINCLKMSVCEIIISGVCFCKFLKKRKLPKKIYQKSTLRPSSKSMIKMPGVIEINP